jgi:ABC-type multidrug transport system fused ATPase/permease subunit
MKYIEWLWHNSRGIRWNTALQIVAGFGQVVLGLLMVWLSKLFIDETIREGSAHDVLRMVCWLVLTVVGGVILRQVGYWLKTSLRCTHSPPCEQSPWGFLSLQCSINTQSGLAAASPELFLTN